MRYVLLCGGGYLEFLAVENFAQRWQSLGIQNAKLHVHITLEVQEWSLYLIEVCTLLLLRRKCVCLSCTTQAKKIQPA